ncbi:MAG: aminopeptidase [Lachnospiraceae bacterium]|nr:aminopeptidase [Lachnospiraceae bacterium]
MEERMELACERLIERKEELETKNTVLPGDWQDFFVTQVRLLLLLKEVRDGADKAPVEKLREWNRELYADILPENYERSWCNPTRAVEAFGGELGRLLCSVAAEMRSAIRYAFEGEDEALLIRMELLLQLFYMTEQGFAEDKAAPEYAVYKEDWYSFVSDYFETEYERRAAQLVDPERDFALRIIREADLGGTDYLYRFGEYITENERKLAEYIGSLPEERIAQIADTWTEGYRIGFVNCGKDLSIKTSVNIRYPLGFERVVRRAVSNFEAMGLGSVIYSPGENIFFGRSVSKNGFFGANPNPQFDYDHREDIAVLLDGQMVTRRLECIEQGFAAVKEKAKGHAGPAVMEVFGETPFVPKENANACRLSEEQRRLQVRFRTENLRIVNNYIPGEERSFTIIAFPVPAIGEKFEEIFDAVVRINTLDYRKYLTIQSVMIDALNGARAVHVRGMGGNRTELTVSLMQPDDKEKQAVYENCVADVNIPVGEIFTTPVLKGTDGILHVSRVFLNELEFRNLSLVFKDGMVTDYDCANFSDPAENRRYIEENVLFHHKSLPMGEAAIGTNTTAYTMARKYGIEAVLPILIAEKTGPHFAVGDTCYSHSEDLRVFNPDGKEIIAKDNEVSSLRKSDPSKAYFGCHTDVTLPYDELGLLEGIFDDGSRVSIIENGRFVLPGTEELNEALDEG